VRVLVRYYLIKPKELRVWGLSRRAQQPAAEREMQADAEPLSTVSSE